jgi:predicted MPP superfamily phosphohydrolase
VGLTAQLTIAAAGIGVAGAAAALASARSASTATATASVVVRTLIVVAGLTLVAGAVVARSPFDAFAFAHLVYLVAVVALPIVGVGLALAAWAGRPPRRALAVVAVPLLLIVPAGVWSTHVAPFQLREDRVALELPPERSLDRPLRIGVLSDIQTIGITGYERSAVGRLMSQEPDVVLIAGDFFQGNATQFREQLPAYRELLGRLDAPGGVFAVPGDVDGSGFEVLFEGTEIVLLRNEVTTTEVEGQRLVIGGVRLDYEAAASQAVYDELEAEGGTDPVLLLAHRPDAVSMLRPGSRVDLTVAGHTHGGQIALPLLGPITTMSDLPRSIGAGGLHEVDGNAIYVSTGVGMERGHAPQIRFLTRPSYGIIELAASPS